MAGVASSGGPGSAVHVKTGGGRARAEEVLSTPEGEAPTPVRDDSAAEATGSQGKKRRKPQQGYKARKRALAHVDGADDGGGVQGE